jgi:hypothetical protein
MIFSVLPQRRHSKVRLPFGDKIMFIPHFVQVGLGGSFGMRKRITLIFKLYYP